MDLRIGTPPHPVAVRGKRVVIDEGMVSEMHGLCVGAGLRLGGGSWFYVVELDEAHQGWLNEGETDQTYVSCLVCHEDCISAEIEPCPTA